MQFVEYIYSSNFIFAAGISAVKEAKGIGDGLKVQFERSKRMRTQKKVEHIVEVEFQVEVVKKVRRVAEEDVAAAAEAIGVAVVDPHRIEEAQSDEKGEAAVVQRRNTIVHPGAVKE